MTDALELAGKRAVDELTRLWALDVIDPPVGSRHPRAAESLEIIDAIIKRNGWGFSLPHGKYLGNGPPQWCGMTAGWAWATAGLDPKWLQVWFASTMRLIAWATYKPWNEHQNPRPAGDDRRLYQGVHPGAALSFAPRAGDILIVGDRRDTSGQHVTVVVSYDAAKRVFATISGNGGGYGPHAGPAREGISTRDYAIDDAHGYRAMHLIRPAFGDLLAELGG